MEQEIAKLTSKLTLEELAEKVYNRIERANVKVLDKSQKEALKQWLSNILANDSDHENRKKNILAKVLVTKKYPDL